MAADRDDFCFRLATFTYAGGRLRTRVHVLQLMVTGDDVQAPGDDSQR